MALLKRSPKPQLDDEGRMSLMDHLRELRNRVVKMMLAVVAGTALGFAFFGPLWDFITGPFCRLPPQYRFNGSSGCGLVVNSLTGGFMVNLKVALIFGLVAAAPFWIYQLWAFVTPGLYRNERRYTLAFLGIAVPLFLCGAGMAYLTMDKGLSLLLGFVPDNVVPLIDIDSYLSFLTMMLLIFGVAFLMPLLMAFLNVIGVLRFRLVSKHQRMIVFLLFVFAAVATPSQDPFTMLALAAPMILLFFVAEIFMYYHDKNAEVREAARQQALQEELDGIATGADDTRD